MATQVSPVGGLTPGMAPTLQTQVSSPSSKPLSHQPAGSRAEAAPRQAVGASRDQEELKTAAQEVSRYLQRQQSDLRFMVDQDTGISYFKIIDPKTQETIRQVPSEEVITMARRLKDMEGSKQASGVLVDEEG
ncbi:MAG: flagellar protein FlaG [Firmicutes bacterium]|nr:flagellar protein FlaG [Bacillota bacterium]